MTDQPYRKLALENFSSEFEKLTGNPPFGWQARLFEECMVVGQPPSALDIPTGLGKTAVIALWLIARAAGADLPRRLVYVVDRHAVMDQASKVAEELRENLSESIADALGLGEGSQRLPISTLRGAFVDNHAWLENPQSPSIIIGTVDMIGSRLLFEGYGVSQQTRPCYAGLLGVDSLVVLDEGHLCPAFDALLRQIAAEQDTLRDESSAPRTESPPLRVMTLSSIGLNLTQETPVFRLQHDEREDPDIDRRISAQKRLQIIEFEDKNAQRAAIAARAIQLATDEAHVRVVVYCDARNDAVAVKKLIDKEIKKTSKLRHNYNAESELLAEERRFIERSDLEFWLNSRGFVGNVDDRPAITSFLVATFAGEVGVDLDADHMICDLVAYERMVQRIGRVNRRGDRDQSLIDVYALRPTSSGSAKRATTEIERFKYQRSSLELLPVGSDGRHDASPKALAALKVEQALAVTQATSQTPLYPALNRPLLDAWSMTSLEAHTGRPEVRPWLHGWEDEGASHTDVVWRRYLPSVSRHSETAVDPIMVREFFQSAPIALKERLVAESRHVGDWLNNRIKRLQRARSQRERIDDRDVVAIVIDHRNEYRTHVTFAQLMQYSRPAKQLTSRLKRERDHFYETIREASLIVDRRIGGLSNGMLDESCNANPLTVDYPSSADTSSKLVSELFQSIDFRIERVILDDDDDGVSITAPKEPGWCLSHYLETHFDDLNVPTRGLAVFTKPGSPTDECAHSLHSPPPSLGEHASQTASKARELASQLGLPLNEIDALEIAALWHDSGKDASRWQNAMNAPTDGRPYAKTRGGGNVRLLDGYRHEFGSLIKAERENLPKDVRDLTLHLIASHHGYSRPTIGTSGCDEGPPSVLVASAGDAALRFLRLQAIYGHWGLAWREAILHAADQIASRASEQTASPEWQLSAVAKEISYG